MSIVLRSGQARSAWDPMYIRQVAFAVVLLGALVRFGAAAAEDGFPAAEWERVTPAELGWSETELAQARSFSDQIRSSAVVIVQHGKVVAECGNTTKPRPAKPRARSRKTTEAAYLLSFRLKPLR